MFSVIMPVWNRAAIVTAAIRSVLSQTCSDDELIIVDDGSGDGLDAVVRPFLGDGVQSGLLSLEDEDARL